MNHVEAQILDLVARLHPETFAKLELTAPATSSYLDETIGRFDREVQFYLAYLEYIEPLKASGSGVLLSARVGSVQGDARPRRRSISRSPRSCSRTGHRWCATTSTSPIPSGSSSSAGRTTAARPRSRGRSASCTTSRASACRYPGRDARLFLPDRIFTHFEREEDIETLRGKFEDELFRIHEILEQATSESVLVMNESFGSTTLRDALLVGTEVMRQIIDLDALCVFVTFVDELASLGESTVSMMSTVVPEDPAVRTYKVVRKPADGLAYAAAIAEKYGLTYEALRRRIAK